MSGESQRCKDCHSRRFSLLMIFVPLSLRLSSPGRRRSHSASMEAKTQRYVSIPSFIQYVPVCPSTSLRPSIVVFQFSKWIAQLEAEFDKPYALVTGAATRSSDSCSLCCGWRCLACCFQRAILRFSVIIMRKPHRTHASRELSFCSRHSLVPLFANCASPRRPRARD